VCAEPIEDLFEAAQASAEAGEVCLVPGQTSLAAAAAPSIRNKKSPRNWCEGSFFVCRSPV